MDDEIYLEVVRPEGSNITVGSWKLPDERIANFDQQEDIPEGVRVKGNMARRHRSSGDDEGRLRWVLGVR